MINQFDNILMNGFLHITNKNFQFRKLPIFHSLAFLKIPEGDDAQRSQIYCFCSSNASRAPVSPNYF